MDSRDSNSENEEDKKPSDSLKFCAQFDGEEWQRRHDRSRKKEELCQAQSSSEHPSGSGIGVNNVTITKSEPSEPHDDDDDFELTADELIHMDYDDDIAEEEEQEEESELQLLAEEGDMPIAELLEKFYAHTNYQEFQRNQEEDDDDANDDDDADGDDDDEDDDDEDVVGENGEVSNNLRSSDRLLNVKKVRPGRSDYDDGSEDSDDSRASSRRDKRSADDEILKDDKKRSGIKEPRIGWKYQADNLPIVKKDDPCDDGRITEEQLWCPTRLNQNEVEKFLCNVLTYSYSGRRRKQEIRIHDNEMALRILAQASYDVIAALSNYKSIPKIAPVEDTWSDSEVLQFEAGILSYGKDFHKINSTLFSKSVKQMIQFYYVWKKSPRYWPTKMKISKKRDINPGNSDYLDRLVEEVDQHFVETAPSDEKFYTHTEALQSHIADLYKNKRIKRDGATAYLDEDYNNVERLTPVPESRRITLPTRATTGDENMPPRKIKPFITQINGC